MILLGCMSLYGLNRLRKNSYVLMKEEARG